MLFSCRESLGNAGVSEQVYYRTFGWALKVCSSSESERICPPLSQGEVGSFPRVLHILVAELFMCYFTAADLNRITDRD